ncbi:hypothetical protein TW65_00717 [Stemphylium lycopersici]|uniref:DUF7918 domain-containing protein n=1 Tax=Stemphylium lycopersici TaxID=183478 RepID=A0A364NBJ6_STELY|nr:hypothetical protein TW65_00717 [Stemphylium lycopersici]RAR14734.1 hypothetical protein DDE83_001957 [Stemphylium lycopersici]
MVVSPTHPGLEVAVLVRGRPLQEYDDDSDEDPAPNTTTKYVEAKTGASFALSAQFKPPFPTRYDVLMRLSIDGKPMAKWYCPREKLYDDVQKKEVVRWQRDGKWMKQKFCFSELDIASLKALRVIPFNDTTRVPLEDRPEEELGPAELRELLRRMRRREAEGDAKRPEIESKAHIKRELAVDDEDEVTIVETRTRKRPRLDPEIIVID